MARCTDPHASRARASRRALLLGATVGCCALIPQSPSALAAKSTTTSTTPPPIEAPALPHNHRSERAAALEGAAAPPTAAQQPVTPEAPAGAHGRHAPPNGAALPPPPPPVSSAGAGGRRAGAGSGSQSARAHERASSTHGAAGTSGASEGAAAPDSTAGDSAAQAQSVESLAQAKKGSGGKGGGGKKQKEKTEKTKGKGKTKEAEGGGESSTPTEAETVKQHGVGSTGAKSKIDALAAAESQPDATALAASVATPAVTASSGTAEASIAAAAPIVKGASGRSAAASSKHRRAHRVKHSGSTAPAVAGTVEPATSALAPVASSASGTPSAPHPTHTAAKRAQASSTQPALVKTITKIVGVVPGPVRILIGVLIALALALGLRSLLASIRTRRLVRQRGELLEDVGLLQAALLPDPPARLGPVGTSVAYRPADGPGAGGDFYDAFALADGRLAVIVGDVSGHGREALPHTALVRFTVRAYLEAGQSPADALQTAGVVLERQLAGSFATVIAAIYHPRERTLTYASAGHPPPVVLGEPAPDGSFTRVATVTACSAPPIGAGMRTGTRETVVSVPGAARLCFHTDGVTEARIGSELFGEARLARTLAALPANAGAAQLLDGVAAQSDARPDDMAACLLHVHGDSDAPAISSERIELDGESLAGGRVERFLRESGIEPRRAAATIDAARAELGRSSGAVLELHFNEGEPTVSVRAENVIQAKRLAVATA
jgi:serine phosphatase RsbU (regulator of sigma subunit)